MSKLIIAPGRARLKIPTVFDKIDQNQTAVVTRSPEWRISFDTIAAGNIKVSSGDKYIELYGWTTETSRYVSGDLNGKLFISGSSSNSDLVVIIPFGPHGPKLEGYMYNGTLIEETKIARFASMQGTGTAILLYTFEDCRIVRFIHCVRYYMLFLQVQSKKVHHWKYDQEKGTNKGNKMTSVHFGTGKVEESSLTKSDDK